MRESAMELDDPLASVRVPAQQELKITEGVAAYNAGDMDKVARFEMREEERRKWTYIIAMSARFVQVYARHHPGGAIIILKIH